MTRRQRNRRAAVGGGTLMGVAIGLAVAIVARLVWGGEWPWTLASAAVTGGVIGSIAGLLAWGIEEDGEAQHVVDRRLGDAPGGTAARPDEVGAEGPPARTERG